MVVAVRKVHGKHGRDHAPTGSDPIPVTASGGAWFAYRNSAAITLASGTWMDTKDEVDTLIGSDLTPVDGGVELEVSSPVGAIRLTSDEATWSFGMWYRLDTSTWNDTQDMYLQSYLYTADTVFSSGTHSIIPAASLVADDTLAARYIGHGHNVPQDSWFLGGIWGGIVQHSGGSVNIPAGSDSDPGLVIWGIQVG